MIDLASNEIICDSLSMPHSPRVHDGKLWLLDLGRGQFGYVDRKTGKLENVAFCPSFARGLAFMSAYAIIGLSKPRRDGTFGDLALDQGQLRARNLCNTQRWKPADKQLGRRGIGWCQYISTSHNLAAAQPAWVFKGRA